MTTNSSLLQQTLDILEVLMERTDEMTLPELELLEGAMTDALKENIADAVLRQQVHTVAGGYAVDPALPNGFSFTHNDERPISHKVWWYRPYITTRQHGEQTIYWVECLDGGCWDRPTWWGEAETLDAAVEICRNGPNWTTPNKAGKANGE
ncbi:hypothetical protein ABWH88_02165 [Marinobacter adhaerens]|uniref:hypothetical protein n=1 Tax=Marinobacter adhaerens TaxID=1033846 RepID=UPI0035D09984